MLRIVVGAGIFIGLYLGLKALTKLMNPNNIEALGYALRTARYALVIFIALGVYPMLFAPAEKLWKKFGWIKEDDTNVYEQNQ